jgi:hypothetical protein
MRLLATLLAVLLCAWALPVLAEDSAEPGHAVIQRARADAALLLPQIGLGGSDKASLDPDTMVVRDFKIDVEGAEKFKGHVAHPAGLDRSRKYALVFALVGEGIKGAEDAKFAGRLSNARDPLILCTLSFCVGRESEDFIRVENIADDAVNHRAFAYVLRKVMDEQPVDKDRVFLLGQGFSQSDAWEWARELWREAPDEFPFRALLFHGFPTGRNVHDMPPVPLILTCDDILMQVTDRAQRLERTPRHFANDWMARGAPCQFHVIPTEFFMASNRWLLIHRDAISSLGGPGPREYFDPDRVVGVITDADKVPFADSADGYVQEIVNLARLEEWERAARRAAEIQADRRINNRDKRMLSNFMREFDRYVKSEAERLNRSLEVSINADVWPHALHHMRMKAFAEAFSDARWFESKPYAANLEKLRTYGPAKRDAERRERLLEAVRHELDGNRAEAKRIYQEVAAHRTQDGGVSNWPRAAEYRLSWWSD